MRTIMAALAAATVIVAPGFATAGDTTCLWRALPEKVRASALATYVSNGNVGNALLDAAVAHAVGECVPKPANAKRGHEIIDSGGVALLAYVNQLGSESALKASLRIEPTKLDQAWAQVPAKTRKSWAHDFLTDGFPSDRTIKEILDASVAAYPALTADQVRKNPQFEHFLMYFSGRAMRQEVETMF